MITGRNKKKFVVVTSAERSSTSTPAVYVRGHGWAWTVATIASLHLIVALTLTINHVYRPEIADGSEAFRMAIFKQYAEGGHNYYPRGDIKHISDGYTPLTSEIFGWTVRLLGPDVRRVRLVAGVLGFAGMGLAGACVFCLTKSRFFAFLGGALVAGIQLKWYLDIGSNTVHAVITIGSLYLLLRDPKLTWKTLVAVGLMLFASFWSKQLGLAYMVAGTVYVLAKNWRKGLALGVGLAILSLVGIVYYGNLENSQFLYWVFEMNQNQPIIWSRLWTVVFQDILTKKYAVSVAFIAAGVMLYERSWKGLFRPELLLLGASAVAGGFANCKYGSGTSQMWVFFMLMIVVGLMYVQKIWHEGRLASPLLGALLGIQGLALIEDPRPFYINTEDIARYQQIMGILSTPGKNSYFINRGFMSFLAGKEVWPQAGEDSWNKKRFDQNMLSRERRAFLQSDPWDIVIIDIPLEDNSYALYERIKQAYKPVYEMPPSSRYPWTYDLRTKKIIFEKIK